MARSLVLANGNFMVAMDRFGLIRDLYYPYVGLENHVGNGHVHLVGVWVDGRLSWLDDGNWQVNVRSEKETLVGETVAVNQVLGVELVLTDVVYNEKDILVRQVEVKNTSDRNRLIKLYFGQQFEIYGSIGGDTAFYEPKRKVVVHYKSRRVFVVNAICEDAGFSDYSVGLYGIEGREGTSKDADDGKLSQNAIEHGQVDSVVGIDLLVPAAGTLKVYYWLVAGKSLKEAFVLNDYVLARHPQKLIQTTRDYWTAWVNKQKFTYFKLDLEVVDLFKKSLLIMRSQVDNRGGIIASGDSNMLHHGRDTYGYVWPRDGAVTAMAMVKAGDVSVARRFFEFCNKVITEEGYMMHKYRPDESLGSSWHPWVRAGKSELPIQEDETAIVVTALWEYYRISKDLEFVESVYNSLVKKAVEFMIGYVDNQTGLPLPSYDLWEEKYGVSTYTCASVYGALMAAAKFAATLGKTESEHRYMDEARKIKEAMLKYLWDDTTGFVKTLTKNDKGEMAVDATVDVSSVYGVYRFGVLEYDDDRVKKAIDIVMEKLMFKEGVRGLPRYQGDKYYQLGEGAPPNLWFVTTLWWVQYLIGRARQESDFDEVKQWLKWASQYALKSGIMSEQLNPYTGEAVAVAPLTWSHAEFVLTVISYLVKLEDLGICQACYDLT